MVSSGATRAKVLRNSRGMMLRRDLDGFPSRPGVLPNSYSRSVSSRPCYQ